MAPYNLGRAGLGRRTLDADFEALVGYLATEPGFELAGFSPSMVARAVRHRMRETGAASLEAYRGLVESDPGEAAPLSHAIFLAYTAFFRDPAHWEFLARRAVPEMLAAAGRPVRIWSAGCASGEEAYTLAIVMAEALGAVELEGRVEIHATDTDDEALAHARAAVYQEEELRPVPARLRRRYFARTAGGHRVVPALVRAVAPARHDLLGPAPFAGVDLAVCRHTLMYFGPSEQERILASLHAALRPGGFLFLEATDRLPGHAERFAPLSPEHPVFVRVPEA